MKTKKMPKDYYDDRDRAFSAGVVLVSLFLGGLLILIAIVK